MGVDRGKSISEQLIWGNQDLHRVVTDVDTTHFLINSRRDPRSNESLALGLAISLVILRLTTISGASANSSLPAGRRTFTL